MVWKDLLTALRSEGFNVSESQVRWAIASGKINRPSLDGSLRFVFTQEHLQQLKRLFTGEKEASCDQA